MEKCFTTHENKYVKDVQVTYDREEAFIPVA